LTKCPYFQRDTLGEFMSAHKFYLIQWYTHPLISLSAGHYQDFNFE